MEPLTEMEYRDAAEMLTAAIADGPDEETQGSRQRVAGRSHGQTRDSRERPTTAVIVTYGSRANFARAAVNGSLDAGCHKAVLVCNNCEQSALNVLKDSFGPNDRVTLIYSTTNMGSAGGFGLGIERALVDDPAFLWLLDDDNLPRPNALLEAFSARETAAVVLHNEHIAVLSYRPMNKRQTLRLSGTSEEDSYPRAGSFLYFDVRRSLRKIILSRREKPRESSSVVTVPYGPYGGLLLPAPIVTRLVLPEKMLTLYEDDTEYTDRIRCAGVSIVLARSSVVDEQEVKWVNSGPGRGPSRLLDSAHTTKAYYATRNRAYFDRRKAASASKSGWYIVNRTIYTLYLLVHSANRRRWRNLPGLMRAIRHGERENLSCGPALDNAKETLRRDMPSYGR